MKRLVIASNNKGKVEEIRELFKDLCYNIVSVKDLGLDIHIAEDQADFAGNSYKKARETSVNIGEIVMADDSGLEVEALNGQPGVHSARFAGEKAKDRDNNEKLLSLMKEIPEIRRKARFCCVITMYWPDGNYLQTKGICTGSIGFYPVGEGGFGYDPLFIPTGYDKTMAELSSEEKNKISHRSIAIKAMSELLSNYCQGCY
ncbi:MAG TPA: non-canonical purine NTP pyrophosphatase [Clostridiales bacterium]|nr:XTP/dITP diphosphatase [Clostridia bacterium]MDD4680728.1 XTP/dITP diphosphatase [Clostridia bacterium]HCS73292.1 non-canonical purine NTP pyrophosphatase [Clostridiales bacterium]